MKSFLSEHSWIFIATLLGNFSGQLACETLCGAETRVESGALTESSPVRIGSRRELFVDDALIEKLHNIEFRLQEPRTAETVLRADQPWEGEFTTGANVIQHGGIYQMYYRMQKLVATSDGLALSPMQYGYAESHEGIHLNKPKLGMVMINGSKDNNAYVASDGAIVGSNAFVDTRPGVKADELYKAVEGGWPDRYAYASADGIHWHRMQKAPVFTPEQWPIKTDGTGINAFWCPNEQCYVGYIRMLLHRDTGKPFDFFVGKDFRKCVRWIARTTSSDFLHWEKAIPIEVVDRPLEQYYTSGFVPYFRAPDICIGLPMRFMFRRTVLNEEQFDAVFQRSKDSFNYGEDCSDALLITSRGGQQIHRTCPEAFVRPGLGYENWGSRSNIPLQGIVQTGPTEISFYINRNYAQKSNFIQRMTLRLDGFISIRAGYQPGGEMVTKPLVFSGKELELNYSTSAAGGIRVEIQNPDGSPYEGYSLEDCQEIIGDEIARIVKWTAGADVSSLAGKPVRLRFVMTESDLFSMKFNP
ncbi:MAG: hypothetical protein ACR2NU_15175 [Aeoliella sp.]